MSSSIELEEGEEDDGIVLKPVEDVNSLYKDDDAPSEEKSEVQEEEDDFFFEGSPVQEEREVAEE